MLNYWIPGIGNNKIINSLNKFFKSLYFIVLVTVLMLISYFFGLEIVIYYVYTILGITIMLLCDDMFPTIPMICTGYMTVSKSQSPIQNKESVLTSKTFLINMIIIGIVLLIGLVLRLIMDLKYKKINKKPKLLVGFILLTASMMLGGIFTKDYSLRTVLYGLLVGVTLCVCYFYLFYTVNWEQMRLDYLAYMFMFIGIGVGIETIHSYVAYDWSIGEFHRSEIYTGWGVYNNVGGVICTCLGLTYYLAATKKNGWVYNIIGGIIMLFVILTQSRNSIIFGLLLSFLGTLLTIIFSKEKERLYNLLITLVMIVGTAALILSSKDLLMGIFGDLADKGLNDSGRFAIYKNGLEAFKVSPIIGNGFYDFDHAPILYFEETSFLAPRYHNTIIQFLASTGIIGLLCYGYHRIQTIILLFKKISVVKIFITVSILAILFNSLLDCQLFNFGPGLHYGVLLVALECLPHKKINFRKKMNYMSSFKNLRIVDNFYQSSAFFPMPLTLIGTLDEKGNTSFGAYSLCFPYYIAGKDYYAMVLEVRNNSNTAKHILRTGKCTINFLPYSKKIFKEHVRLGFPGDTPEEKMKEFKFHLEEGLSCTNDPDNQYPKVISEALQVFECTWVKELDGAENDQVQEEYNGPYHNFNGITSKYGAHFILKIDHILMKDKYYDAIINGVTKKNFCPLPTNWGYRDSKNFWCSGYKKADYEGIPDKEVDLTSIRYAADRADDVVKFTDDALLTIVKVPRPFLKLVLKGCVDWAKENNCTLITEKEMKIISDKRNKDKKKK